MQRVKIDWSIKVIVLQKEDQSFQFTRRLNPDT